MKTSIKYGGIISIAGILTTLVMYFIDPALIFNLKLTYGVFLLLNIVLLILGLREERKNNEGFLSFGDGLKSSFISYAIGIFISTIFTYVLMNHIDPSLLDRGVVYMQETGAKTLNWTAEMTDISALELDKALEDLKTPEAVENFRNAFGLSSTMLNLMIMLIFPGCLFWLIIPAIMKKNPQGV